VRRIGLLIAGWAFATVVVLILGLQGVSAISDSVTRHPKASLSRDSVKAALDRSGSSTESSSSSSADGSASSSDTALGSTTGSDLGAQQAPPSNESASSGDERGSESEGGSSVNASHEDRTYRLVGGSVGVRFANGEAHLLWATPNSGFSVDSSGSSSNVDVRFESDNHESRLKAFWDGGPQQEIEEK
jgi:hypothetical protein